MHILWRFRSGISGEARRRIRAATDPLVGPLGSIRGARTADPVMAITFDDGPDDETTPRILDVLRIHEMHATFFVLVDRAERNAELIERMVGEGHEIALHGADHQRLTSLPRRRLRSHIEEGVHRLAELTGSRPRWFRPPYGAQSVLSYAAARRLGLKVVVWSVDCEDWENGSEQEIAARAVQRSSAGAILLVHDSLADRVKETDSQGLQMDRALMLDLILHGLSHRGLRGVTVQQLMQGRTPHLTAWFRP